MIIYFQIEIAVIMDYMFNKIEKAYENSLQIRFERILMANEEAKSSKNDSREQNLTTNSYLIFESRQFWQNEWRQGSTFGFLYVSLQIPHVSS